MFALLCKCCIRLFRKRLRNGLTFITWELQNAEAPAGREVHSTLSLPSPLQSRCESCALSLEIKDKVQFSILPFVRLIFVSQLRNLIYSELLLPPSNSNFHLRYFGGHRVF